MKKIILLILSLSLLLSNVCFAADAEESTESKYEYEVQLLDDLGILTPEYAGVTNENSVITRGTYIKLLMNIVYHDYTIVARANPFTDLAKNDPAYQNILDAYAMGVIDRGNGVFNSKGIITYEDAIEYLVRALGYGAFGEARGYIAQASALELNKGLTIESNITYREVAKLMWNTLQSPVASVDITGANGGYSINTNSRINLLEKNFNIYETEGIISENCLTSLDDTISYSDNHIKIGNLTGYIYNTDFAINNIGAYVKAYYNISEKNETIFLHAKVDDHYNDIVTIDASQIIGVTDNSITYDTGSRKTKTINIPASTSVIVNGDVNASFTSADFDILEGRIIVIDNDRDDVVEVVNVIEYTDMVVAGVKQGGNAFVGRDGAILSLEAAEGKYILISDAKHNRVDKDAIKMNDVLTYFQSENKRYTRIIISNEMVSGRVSAIFTENGNTSVTIDGTDYLVSDRYVNGYYDENSVLVPGRFSQEVSTGLTADFYVNYFGRIVACVPDTDIKNYAYFIKFYEDEIEGRIIIKMMDGYGQINKYKLAEKYTLDDVVYKNNVQTEFYDNGSLIDARVFTSNGNPADGGQLVRIKLNKDREINYIDRVSSSYISSSQPLYTINQKSRGVFYYQLQRSFSNMYPVNDNTVFMVVPQNLAGTSDKDYYVTTAASMERTEGVNYVPYTTTKDNYMADVILVETNLTVNIKEENPDYIVTGISTVVSGDEIVKSYKLVDTAGKVSQFIFDNKAVSDACNADLGDIIKAKTSGDVILAAEVLYDYSTDTITKDYGTTYGILSAYGNFLGNIVFVSESGTHIGIKIGSTIKLSKVDGTTYQRYEKNGNKVHVENISIDTLRYYARKNAKVYATYGGSFTQKTVLVIE